MLAIAGFATPESASAQVAGTPPARAGSTTPIAPYTMRDVPLGITLEEFRTRTIPSDTGQYDLDVNCTSDGAMPKDPLSQIEPRDQADGIATCEWWGREKRTDNLPSTYQIIWIDLGEGKGQPAFDFVSDGSVMRLFRIRFYANSDYSTAIRHGLTDRYGAPSVTTGKVRTGAGIEFDTDTLTWNNGASSIVFESPCRRIDRYCLTYRHSGLYKVYDAILAKRAAAAAERF